jgi:hypothetical protein
MPDSSSLYQPRFPPELFLEIFSHADCLTLAALSSSSLAFLELAIPFLYSTVHFDDLAKSSTPRSPRIAELLPLIALNSVRTLHLPSSNFSSAIPTLSHSHDPPALPSQTIYPSLPSLATAHGGIGSDQIERAEGEREVVSWHQRRLRLPISPRTYSTRRDDCLD